MSILDFYVHESVQRMGVGKQLFQVVMKLADFGDAWRTASEDRGEWDCFVY